MGKSYKKTPISGITTAHSEKEDKRLANRALRRVTRYTLNADPDTEVLPILRDVSNVWSMAKDGKRYFNPKKFPKYMRK